MSHRLRGRHRPPKYVAWLLVVAAVMLAGIAGAYATAAPKEADPTEKVESELLEEVASSGEATFWVYLAEEADLEPAKGMKDRKARGRFVHGQLVATANRSQAALKGLLDAKGAEHESFWIVNALKVTGDAELIAELAARPEVKHITADRTYEIPEPTEAEIEEQIEQVEWGIANIRANEAWAEFGTEGEGIVVGSIDTGVLFTHPALVAQYRGNNGDGTFDHNYNWHDPSNVCGNPSLAPCDNNGHGTHVHGTMVGDGGPGNKIGVAPKAEWIAAKGCESTSCSQSALLSSGQFILAPTNLQGQSPNPDKRPHIVNNSWGGGATTDPWYRPTVEAWVAAGIFPQFANGNTQGTAGCNSASNPGNLPESYSSGAYDVNNVIGSFSNRGPSAFGGIIKPNIAAPGVAIRSAWNNGAYNTISGTSMASPHVAGVVALMWSAASALERDIDTTRELLDLTARDTSNLVCGGTPENNNVFGQGRVDAFAAVEESPRGPTGTLQGTVTDAESGNPVAGATVSIEGPVSRSRTTAADGTYSITLPVGDYDVTVSRFAYQSQTKSAAVTEGAETTLDFALERAPSKTITGKVTDGTSNGHTWPLYAKVSAKDTPEKAYTNPLTGEYTLSLPANATYELVFESQYPGYASKTVEVELEDENVTEDVQLHVERCASAPGYEFTGSIAVLGDDASDRIVGYLESEGIPATALTWATLPATAAAMEEYDVIVVNRPGTPPGGAATFNAFLANTDAAGTNVIFLDTWSTSGNGIWMLWNYTGNPATRATGFSSSIQSLSYQVTAEHPILSGLSVDDHSIFDTASTFKDHAWFGGYTGDGRQVIANAFRNDLGVRGGGIGVQERASNRHVLLSMHASSAFAGPRFWHEDAKTVFLNSLAWAVGADLGCEKVDGGLVVGTVTDKNTGDGVVGVTVANDDDSDQWGKSAAMPDDPNLDDGFYWLFSSAGSQSFTASMPNYQSHQKTVAVAEDDVTEADFELGAGKLTVTPAEVQATVQLGQAANRTLTIENTGTAAAEIDLAELPGSFQILDGGPAGAAPAQVTGSFVPASGVEPSREYDPDSATTEGQYAEGGTPARWVGPTAAGEVIRSWLPTGVALAWGVGFDGNVWLSDVPDNRRNHEFTTAGAATGRSHSAAWAGAWPGDMSRSSDPGEICQVNVGGDNGIYCWSDSTGAVTRSITGSFPWTSVSQRGLAYREDDDTFYIGGWNQNVLYQVRGFSHSTPGQVVKQCSFAGMGIAGLAWNPTAKIVWIATNSASDTIFRVDPETCEVQGSLAHPRPGFNGGGLEMDDAGNLWMLEQRNEGGENRVYLIDSGVPHITDVEWLSLDPTSATLQPGQRLQVTVRMDSSKVQQPGTYTAGIGVRHDTPYTVDPVGVRMVVTAPPNWGKVTGKVTGVSCHGTSGPLAGALVQVNRGNQELVTLFTDGEGNYAHWMPSQSSALTLIVAHGWTFKPQTRQTQVHAGRTVTQNFALGALCN
jgi:subtilisin family serine protease